MSQPIEVFCEYYLAHKIACLHVEIRNQLLLSCCFRMKTTHLLDGTSFKNFTQMRIFVLYEKLYHSAQNAIQAIGTILMQFSKKSCVLLSFWSSRFFVQQIVANCWFTVVNKQQWWIKISSCKLYYKFYLLTKIKPVFGRKRSDSKDW